MKSLDYAADDCGKTVFVCTWAPPMAGGPRNLYNHLKSWPAQRYALVTSYLNFSWSVLEPSTWLPCDYVFFDYHGNADRTVTKIKVDPLMIRYRLIDKLDAILNRFGQLLNKLKMPKPNLIDSIYQFGRSCRVFFACAKYSRSHKISQVVIISDMGWGFIGGFLFAWFYDKPLKIFLFDLYADNYMLSGNKILAQIFEPIIFKFADGIIVTNETTQSFLEKKYPYLDKINVVRNSSDLEPKKLTDVENYSNSKKPFIISFAGHIYWPHMESFKNLVECMKLLEQDNVILKMYVINPSEEVKVLIKGVKNIVLDYLPREQLTAEIQKSQLLFLPFSWNTQSPEIIRTASPAKFTDYLAAGVPFLVHAPKDSFVCEFAEKKKLGIVVPENSAIKLADKVRDFMKLDQNQAQEYARNCIRFFNEEFKVDINSERLWKFTNE
ncbi:MAG: glycosyltransferase [Bdellovibrionaceae bacterium]|nr:glycosyltransferase [Pseudobdellovibrionaceae bacterium]